MKTSAVVASKRDQQSYINVTEDDDEQQVKQRNADLLSRTFHEQMQLHRLEQKVKSSDSTFRGSVASKKAAAS